MVVAVSAARRGFQVVAGYNLTGYGPTPGLALRSLWREVERRALAGEHPSGAELLPARRVRSLQRKAAALSLLDKQRATH